MRYVLKVIHVNNVIQIKYIMILLINVNASKIHFLIYKHNNVNHVIIHVWNVIKKMGNV